MDSLPSNKVQLSQLLAYIDPIQDHDPPKFLTNILD